LGQVNSIVSSTGKVPAILGVGWDWFGIGTADAVRVAKDCGVAGGVTACSVEFHPVLRGG
jgi:hypothetical protein